MRRSKANRGYQLPKPVASGVVDCGQMCWLYCPPSDSTSVGPRTWPAKARVSRYGSRERQLSFVWEAQPRGYAVLRVLWKAAPGAGSAAAEDDHGLRPAGEFRPAGSTGGASGSGPGAGTAAAAARGSAAAAVWRAAA